MLAYKSTTDHVKGPATLFANVVSQDSIAALVLLHLSIVKQKQVKHIFTKIVTQNETVFHKIFIHEYYVVILLCSSKGRSTHINTLTSSGHRLIWWGDAISICNEPNASQGHIA